MSKNNFQRLDDDFFNERTSEQIQRVKSNIDGSVSFIQMVSKIVEVYLPRVFDVFMLMSGGKPVEEKVAENNSAKFNKPPSAGGFSDFGSNSGPSSPDA